MDFVSLSKSRHFLDAKPVRVPVFDRPRLAAELVCLVPGQKEMRRNQEICDELYVVVEGTGTLRSGANVQELEPSDAVVVPPGVDRILTNTGAQPLTVLVALSPKPSFANQSSPRRNAPRRNVDEEEEAVEEPGDTERAGFDESRSGPSIGRPKRVMTPSASEDRPRPAARGGSGPMRNDAIDDRPQPARGAGRPFPASGSGGARRTFNRDDRPVPARRPFNAPQGDGENAAPAERRPFNRDDRPRGPRPAFGGNRNGRPGGGRPFREAPADGRPRRMPGSVAGPTAPQQRVRDNGPDAESRFRRPAGGPARGDARPAGARSGPARPRRAPFSSKEGTQPVGQRGRGPTTGGGTYSPRGAAGRRAAPRNAGGPAGGGGGATRRPTGRPAPGRSAPRTSGPRTPRA